MARDYEIYDVKAELYECNQEYYPNCIAFKVMWDANVGFGELLFMYDTEKEEWTYDTECMGEEFCKLVLNKWIELLMK